MSVCYGPLAAGYDELTEDVPYGELTDWYETALRQGGRAVHTVLDLCCGTGTLSLALAKRGYELISADASAEMLSVFQQKLSDLPETAVPPLLLCQRAEELDLNDTVDAAVCCLDGFNYFSPELLPEILRRLRLFIAPEGMLCFDVLSPERMRSLDGECFVDEREDLLCLWRASVEGGELCYDMDLFRPRGTLGRREQEQHGEYIHEPAALRALLERAGFGDVTIRADGPQHGEGRLFLSARRI